MVRYQNVCDQSVIVSNQLWGFSRVRISIGVGFAGADVSP